MTVRSTPATASGADPLANGKLNAPAAERNVAAITDLLRRVAPPTGEALELASGTGQHVTAFAAALPGLIWQPTEPDALRLASIAAYRAEAGLANLRAPEALDATVPGWGKDRSVDLVVLVNLLHLISEAEAKTLITEAAKALRQNGVLVIYGPFMRAGELTSDGDRAFHQSLVSHDQDTGYKDDFDTLDQMVEAGLSITLVGEMPANNLALVGTREF